MRYAGLLEAVKIRKAGFTIRRTFCEFFNRFRVLLPKGFQLANNDETNCRVILENIPQLRDLADHATRYRFGKTKIFFKEKEVTNIFEDLNQSITELKLCERRD